MQQPLLNDMRLVGGTSLALQYGHRRSVDLDFFGKTTEDIDELTDVMHQCASQVVRGNCTKNIKALLSMTYFADADPQPMPFMFSSVAWETIKKEIKDQVEEYNKMHL